MRHVLNESTHQLNYLKLSFCKQVTNRSAPICAGSGGQIRYTFFMPPPQAPPSWMSQKRQECHFLPGMAKMLSAHPDRAAWIHEWLSQVTGDELRGEGLVYGGGLNKIEPKELARISAKQLLAHWPEISSVTDAQSELFANPSLTKTLVA